MSIIEIKDIHKSYSNHKALENINLSIPKQSIYGLLGPNGAGKTTLIRIINQIIAADSGEILIKDEKLNQSHIEIIGYLPEERGLYKKMKVGDQLLYFARLKGLSRSEAINRIKVWFKKFEIGPWWGKKIEDLSKGMQQKIQFIGTVIHQPELIILDEPFSGFDPINANLIKDEILELREKGATIIFSTHRMESVEELCDHIALIHNAKTILQGPKQVIKENHRSNTFIVEHHGDVNELNGKYQLINKEKLDESIFRSLIKIEDSENPNNLLKELLNQTQVRSFMEKIPTMNDIFIQEVNITNRS